MKDGNPADVVIKTMNCNRTSEDVFDFFQNIMNWESGGVLRSISKYENDWWICDTPIGMAKIKCSPDKYFRILDHTFIVGDIEWNVYVRVMANNKGSTTSWTFLKPNGLIVEQFQEQLKGFDLEIDNWKKTLEK